ncbi:MAG: lamin tail domain-containing protein [Patescibacteria group bacterium]|nr:lamin tail domain-containing protein [Patescibacteria group bacterium]
MEKKPRKAKSRKKNKPARSAKTSPVKKAKQKAKPRKKRVVLKARKWTTPRRRRVARKSSRGFSIKKTALRITALFLLFTMNAVMLRGISETRAYLSDMEASENNTFAAGILDFALDQQEATSSLCALLDKPKTRTVHIANFGNPFKYAASTSNFSNELCDYVLLKADLGGGDPEYVGPLKSFNAGLFDYSDPEDWNFSLTVASNTPAEFEGQVCDYNLNFLGSQIRNDLPFPKGFFDFEEADGDVQAPYCKDYEIKSMGYWKTHPEIYLTHLPQSLGASSTDDVIDTKVKVNLIFTADSSIARNNLKKQLLAMKFNIAHFLIGEHFVESEEETLNEIASTTDELLRQDTANSVLEERKNLLEGINNSAWVKICSCLPPPPKDSCDLKLTKTTASKEVKPGDPITYHFTFDNIGTQVCTGGGVRIRDTFGPNLEFISYASSRTLRSFSKTVNYLEWNFGSIYPSDPLIELELEMKVKDCAPCDSTLVNSAKYWSNQTDWSLPVTAESKIVCEPEPGAEVVINEFLPNPAGYDNALKPNGEWVELYNKGSEEIDVSGWVLYDGYLTHELLITPANTGTGSTTIAAGEFLVVYRDGDSDFTLDNTGGDLIRLYDSEIDDGGNLIDSYTYASDAPEGKSFARIPDGSDNWVDPIPTPGEENLLIGENIVFGAALPEEGEEGYIEPIAVADNLNEPITPIAEEDLNIETTETDMATSTAKIEIPETAAIASSSSENLSPEPSDSSAPAALGEDSEEPAAQTADEPTEQITDQTAATPEITAEDVIADSSETAGGQTVTEEPAPDTADSQEDSTNEEILNQDSGIVTDQAIEPAIKPESESGSEPAIEAPAPPEPEPATKPAPAPEPAPEPTPELTSSE